MNFFFFRFSLLILTANLRGFRASMNPRFEGGIPDFMDKFNTLYYST